ncbi:hypothetical protein AB0M86_43110 [Streptomyces sp. NPDC051639]|uniref:hypothetical protein n=1 Tax=Streptomyces sp. NPDC051639 TaxID=3155671 RepID=UPI0034134031
MIRSVRGDPGDRLGDGVVDAVALDQGAEVLDGEPGDGHPSVDGCLPERFAEV